MFSCFADRSSVPPGGPLQVELIDSPWYGILSPCAYAMRRWSKQKAHSVIHRGGWKDSDNIRSCYDRMARLTIPWIEGGTFLVLLSGFVAIGYYFPRITQCMKRFSHLHVGVRRACMGVAMGIGSYCAVMMVSNLGFLGWHGFQLCCSLRCIQTGCEKLFPKPPPEDIWREEEGGSNTTSQDLEGPWRTDVLGM